MEISGLYDDVTFQRSLSQGCDTDINLLSARDTNAAPSKLSKPHTSEGAGTERSQQDVLFIGKDVEQLSRPAVNAISTDINISQHLHDCAALTPMQLRKTYPREANSHRNMLQREKDHGRIVHDDFRIFGNFLTHVGPQPFKGATLDRIDNTDPEYGPGKVRWADRQTQNSNKGDTLGFHCSRSGKSYSVRSLAARQGVSRSAIRKRHERGWSDDDIIAGTQASQAPCAPSVKTLPPRAETVLLPPLDVVWEQAMATARPGECHTLMQKEKAMIHAFATFCKAAGRIYDAEDILRYILDNWTKYTDLLHNDYGVAKPAAVPTPGLIAAHPRAAVNLWLKANSMELKGGVAALSTPTPTTAAALSNAPLRAPTRPMPRWDESPWDEVLPESYEDDTFPAWSRDEAGREAHARHVVGVWAAHGSPIMKDFPQWAKDILTEKVPTFASRLRELEERPSAPELASL